MKDTKRFGCLVEEEPGEYRTIFITDQQHKKWLGSLPGIEVRAKVRVRKGKGETVVESLGYRGVEQSRTRKLRASEKSWTYTPGCLRGESHSA